MPKLNKNSLEKRFICEYCGEPIRTRQGLSGHIQFKHKLLQNSNGTYMDKLLQIRKRLVFWRTSANEKDLSKDMAKLGEDILDRWQILIGYFELLNIKLSDNDFKNFFIQNFRISSSRSADETQLALEALKLLKPKI